MQKYLIGIKIRNLHEERSTIEIAHDPQDGMPLITVLNVPDGETFGPLFGLMAYFFDGTEKAILTIKRDQTTWIVNEAWPRHICFGKLDFNSDPCYDMNIEWIYESIVKTADA